MRTKSRVKRQTGGIVLAALLAWGCGGDAGRDKTPIAPGGLPAPASVVPGAVNAPGAGLTGATRGLIDFPPRDELVDFRKRALEEKYRSGLGQSLQPFFVDPLGSVVWVQEYVRYRVNGCGHEDAVVRVFAAVDIARSGSGVPAPAVCQAAARVSAFPPREEPFDFRKRLEVNYQAAGATPELTHVDMEGDVIWTQEYLRYRLSGCTHQIATDKVLSQIDTRIVEPVCGGPPPPPPPPRGCRYRVSPADQAVGASGGDFQARVTTAAECRWTASGTASWITVRSGATGSGNGTISYSAAPNGGSARIGAVQVRGASGGSAQSVQLRQSGSGPPPPPPPPPPPTPLTADFTWSPKPCQLEKPEGASDTIIRCTFNASSSSPQGSIAKYTWDFRALPGSNPSSSKIIERTTPTITGVSLGCGTTGTPTDPGTLQFDRSVFLTVTSTAGAVSEPKMYTVSFRLDSGC